MIDLFNAHGLAGERFAEIDFLAVKTQAAAAGDHNGAVMERVVRLGNVLVEPRRSDVNLGRTLHFQGLMRPLVIELLYECVELGLLLQDVGAGGSRGFDGDARDCEWLGGGAIALQS